MSTASLDWAHRKQDTTLAYADAWGEPWTREDIDHVRKHTDVKTDEELALDLGRTLYALWAMQHRLAQGLEPQERRVRHGVLYERTYTFIGDDCPPGWND